MMGLGQLLAENLGLGGALVSLISVGLVSYAIRSSAESEAPKGVTQTGRPPQAGNPRPPPARKIFMNRE